MSTNLHPLMAAALAPFAPPLSGLHKPEPVEYEEGTCASCSGSVCLHPHT